MATAQTIERRAILKGAAGAVALMAASGVEAASVAAGPLPAPLSGIQGPDPVLAAIAAHERANAAFKAFNKRLEAWEQANPSPRDVMLEDKPTIWVEVEGQRVAVRSEEELGLALAMDGLKRGNLPNPADEGHPAFVALRAEFERRRVELRRQVEAIKAGDAWGEASGWNAMCRENDRLCELTEAAYLKVLETTPTTIGGCAAMIDFIEPMPDPAHERCAPRDINGQIDVAYEGVYQRIALTLRVIEAQA
jgi:hypothetical protein